MDARQRQGAANATVNRELAAFKWMFHLGQQATPAKVLRMRAFPKLKENNVRKGFLEDAQYRKLVEGSELWFRALVECDGLRLASVGTTGNACQSGRSLAAHDPPGTRNHEEHRGP